jgi:hypothetical protein
MLRCASASASGDAQLWAAASTNATQGLFESETRIASCADNSWAR